MYVDFNQLSVGNKMAFCAFPWPKASNKIMVDFVWGAKFVRFYWDYFLANIFDALCYIEIANSCILLHNLWAMRFTDLQVWNSLIAIALPIAAHSTKQWIQF